MSKNATTWKMSWIFFLHMICSTFGWGRGRGPAPNYDKLAWTRGRCCCSFYTKLQIQIKIHNVHIYKCSNVINKQSPVANFPRLNIFNPIKCIILRAQNTNVIHSKAKKLFLQSTFFSKKCNLSVWIVKSIEYCVLSLNIKCKNLNVTLIYLSRTYVWQIVQA